MPQCVWAHIQKVVGLDLSRLGILQANMKQ